MEGQEKPWPLPGRDQGCWHRVEAEGKTTRPRTIVGSGKRSRVGGEGRLAPQAYAWRRTRFVSASPHDGHTKTCSSGVTPTPGTLRISFITWPHAAQTAIGKLSGKGAINHLARRPAHPATRPSVSGSGLRRSVSQGLRPGVYTRQYRNCLPPKKVRSRSPPHPPDDPGDRDHSSTVPPTSHGAISPCQKAFLGRNVGRLWKCSMYLGTPPPQGQGS